MKNGLLILLIIFNNPCAVTAQSKFTLVKPERIYLHTDRNIYIAGENLYYSMYLEGGPGQTSRYAYLLLHDADNSLVTQVRLEKENQRSFGNIFLSDTLKSGYYQITCFTNLMRNAEESIFRKEIVIANRFDEKLDQFPEVLRKPELEPLSEGSSETPLDDGNLIIHLDKQVFNTREKISFSIENRDQTRNPIASLSVSVSEYFPGSPKEPGISDYFVAGKDSPNMGDASNVICKFISEFTGAVLQGRVLSENIAGTVNNYSSNTSNKVTILLSTIDSITNLQFTTTDSLGSFAFYLNPYYDGKGIIIKLKDSANATIELDKKTDLEQSFVPSASYNIKGIKDYLIHCGKIIQVQRYYSKKGMMDTVKMFPRSFTIPRVYYKSNSVILPSDYIELPDFIELSREIIPALKISKKKDNYESRYVNLRYQTDSDDGPAIFLDGVPIDDINQIIKLGTSDIKRIESLPAIRYYGALTFPGILSVFSTFMEINNIQFKTPVVRYQVLESRSYTKPVLFKPESIIEHTPDLRQVLLWEPDMTPENNEKVQIECFASDVQGNYRIDIQGISSNGDLFNGSAVFTVKAK